MINLINFHTFDKNKKYIAENTCATIGQGLYNSYSVILYGNGHNIYVFDLELNGKQFKLEILECHLTDWIIRAKYEEIDHEVETLKFSAYGKVNSKYYVVSNNGCDDYEHLNVNCIKCKILDINVYNSKPTIPLIRDIINDDDHINAFTEKYKFINKLKISDDLEL